MYTKQTAIPTPPRVSNGKSPLHGITHRIFPPIMSSVPINNGPNSLHGGIEGFSYKVFDYEFIEDGVKFHYVSKDGEEGYPGTLDFYAYYTIEGTSLHMRYEATSDQDTIINITNHSYFNLNGHASSVHNHVLKLNADEVGCVDGDGLYTG